MILGPLLPPAKPGRHPRTVNLRVMLNGIFYLLTLAGRIHVPYLGWSRHVALLQAGATIGAAKLWYDRNKQRF